MGDQLKDGLPRSAYAYAPTADPSTWKLPFRTDTGAPDPDHLPGAAAALSESGFRGDKADIPSEVVPAVKAKLRQAYKQWGKSPDEYPASIREVDPRIEGEFDRTLREAHEGHYFGAWTGGTGGHPIPFKGDPGTGTATEGKGGHPSDHRTDIDHPNLPPFEYNSIEGRQAAAHALYSDLQSRLDAQAGQDAQLNTMLQDAAAKGYGAVKVVPTSGGNMSVYGVSPHLGRGESATLMAKGPAGPIEVTFHRPMVGTTTVTVGGSGLNGWEVSGGAAKAFLSNGKLVDLSPSGFGAESFGPAKRPGYGAENIREAGSTSDEPIMHACVYTLTKAAKDATVKESDVSDAIDLAEVGARNSKADQGRIQSAHDHLMAAGAKCSPDNVDPMDGDDNPVDQVKEAWAFDDKAKSHDVAFHEATGGDSLMVTLAEAGAEFDDARREVWVTPIRPGFGNPRDARYYPLDTVREAVEAGTFNNRKMYANHPTKREEGERPERDVRDWVGVIRETKWDAKRGVPRSRVQVLDDSVYAKWKAAPDHVSFSVLGKGKARDGRVGNRNAQIVESIARINSVDWVTEAGAGGSIDFAEADYEESDMDFASMTPAQRAAALAELQTAIREAGDDDDGDGDKGTTPKDTATPKATEPNEPTGGNQGASKGGSGDASAKAPEGATPNGFVKVEDFEALQKQVAAMKVREAAIEGRQRAGEIVGEMIRESDLPRAARDYLSDRFRESAVGEGFGYADDEALKAEVEKEISDFRRVAEATGIRRPSNVRGLGNAGDQQPKSLRESLESDIDGRMGRDLIPFRETNESGVPAGQPSKGASQKAEASIASRV